MDETIATRSYEVYSKTFSQIGQECPITYGEWNQFLMRLTVPGLPINLPPRPPCSWLEFNNRLYELVKPCSYMPLWHVADRAFPPASYNLN